MATLNGSKNIINIVYSQPDNADVLSYIKVRYNEKLVFSRKRRNIKDRTLTFDMDQEMFEGCSTEEQVIEKCLEIEQEEILNRAEFESKCRLDTLIFELIDKAKNEAPNYPVEGGIEISVKNLNKVKELHILCCYYANNWLNYTSKYYVGYINGKQYVSIFNSRGKFSQNLPLFVV